MDAAPTSTVPSVVDYSQCANGAPPSTSKGCPGGWINGILQSSNSHYREDDVTPQRLMMSVPAAGSGSSKVHTVKLSYQTRKDSAPAHAYDSLTTWDLTQDDADKCLGLKGCPGGQPSTIAIPPDGIAVEPAGPGIDATTSKHSIPGVMTMYGGTLTGISSITHSNPTLGSGDDYATLTVSFTVPASSKAQNALLLFGGHLAPSTGDRGWGTGLGSGNINGGPYHIKLDAIDNASAGSRDNQIQAAAILPLAPPEFTITKSAKPTTVNAGEPVEYTITVTNTGGSAGSTTFTDDYDSRIEILSVPTGCTNDTQTTKLTCTTGTIDPTKSQIFTYTAKMPATFTGEPGGNGCSSTQYPVKNTATLANGKNASATVCVNAAPKFTITKTADPTTTTPGSQVKYTITVTNSGSAPGSTTFTDVYDSRITNVSTPAGCTKDATNHKLTCTTGTIDPTKSQVFEYTANMPATFTGEPGGNGCSSTQYPVTNTATLQNGSNASATVCVDAEPAFVISKSADPTTTTPGSPVKYTITVTNNGSAPGSTTFTDVYDSRITNVSTPAGCTKDAANHKLTCTTGTIDPTKSQVFEYTANMPATFTGEPGGNGCSDTQYPVKNTATLQNGKNASATVCVNAAPKFTITKKADPTVTNPGGIVTYTITVTNTGNASGSTTFVDGYQHGVKIDEESVPLGCENKAENNTLTCTTGTIDPTKSQIFIYKATMPSSFTGTPPTNNTPCSNTQFPVTNTASISTEITSTSTVCVNVPVLTVSKAECIDDVTVPVNGYLSYTITYQNNGSAPATGVTLVDTIPNGTEVSDAGGGTVSEDGKTVTWDLGTLEVDDGDTRTLTVHVLPTTPEGTALTNTATIDSIERDAVASNSVTNNVSNAGSAASGRAYGVSVEVTQPVAVTVPPTPDVTDGTFTQANVAVPAGTPIVTADALNVSNTPTISATQAEDEAVATATNVNVVIPDLVDVKATAVQARSDSIATSTTANTVTNGSVVLDLSINGQLVDDVISSPRVIPIVNLFGVKVAEVRVLEHIDPSGAAIGGAEGAQPGADGLFDSGLTVNGIHITLLDGSTDVVVSHAESEAAFPSAFPCGQDSPYVIGRAVIADETLTYPDGPTTVLVDEVILPSTGSAGVTSTASTADLTTIGATSGTGTATTKGTLSPLYAESSATVQNLLLSGLTAEAISSLATADSPATTEGSTTIAKLIIGTLDVCVTLGVQDAVCTPAPNTTLVDESGSLLIVLNEQIVNQGGKVITVNAVHIFVLATDNVLGLEVGSDLIISGSTAGTS